MKGFQKRLQAVASMPVGDARAELARVSTVIESRYGANRRTRRRLTVGDKVQASQLRRLRSKLLDRINAEGDLTNDEKRKKGEVA
jgi:hypothetical protein